ncbi:Zinc finger MYM-type protein 1 [Glycine soja]
MASLLCSKSCACIGFKLKSHKTCYEHVTNMDKWIELETRLRKKNTIDKEIQEQINKEEEHWEKVLVRIITIIKYLSKSNLLAFCGTNEKIYQKGNGNFLSLIKLLAEFNPVMQEHNELIELLTSQIKNIILKKLKMQNIFLILDCTLDVSHREQMTLILRYVDTFSCPVKIEKYFLEFLQVNDTTGKRGQGYDNESNTKGKNQGVQKRLLDINLRAYYTPCGNMANSCKRAVSFIRVLQRIYSLFVSSTKQWKILQENVSKFSVKSLSQTRWECRIKSSKAIKFQATKIRDTLVQLLKTSEDPKIKSEAICLTTYEMKNFEFLLGMNIWYDTLFAVNSN